MLEVEHQALQVEGQVFRVDQPDPEVDYGTSQCGVGIVYWPAPANGKPLDLFGRVWGPCAIQSRLRARPETLPMAVGSPHQPAQAWGRTLDNLCEGWCS